MKWTDMNGKEHEVFEGVEIRLQQPNCKYLLPCGLCTLTPENYTCSLLRGKNNGKEENT